MVKVKLGDIAREYKETIQDVSVLPIVALEHLTPGEITLEQWDEDVKTTFSKGFRKGHVLFGRRRAYLKKAAVAPFDGVCSGDIIVVEALPEMIRPELLPYIIQNDLLFDFAMEKSAGGLSPRVKWVDLKEFEFTLPTLLEQDALVDILSSAYDTKKAYQTLIRKTDKLVKSQFVEMFGARFQTELIKVEQIATPTIGLTYKPENTSAEGTIVLRSGNIQNSELTLGDDVVRVSGIKIPENKYVRPGDILMCSRNGSASLVGKCCRIPACTEDMAFGAFMTVIRSDYPAFLFGFFQSHFFKKQLTNVGTTSINQITTKMLNAYETVMPTAEEEKQFADFIVQADKSKFELKKAIDKINAMMKSFINNDNN